MPPPTRAKRAIEEAPKENPVTIANTLLTSAGFPVPNILLKIRKSSPRPSTPKPTTPKPITEPPAKAMLRPSLRLLREACVVRTLALVATRMPIKPAKPEQKAPTTKDTATNQCEVLGWAVMPSMMATQTTNMAITLYSAFKKAKAPFWMLEIIVTILFDPVFCFLTQDDLR